jgi:phage RecT family recombinase
MAYRRDEQDEERRPQRNRPPVMTRDDVSSLLRKSFPKFKRISENDAKTGLMVLNASREASFAIQRVVKEKRLLECDPVTLRDAYENCAMIGLSLNPALQYAAIIPVWNKDRGVHEAVLWPMYRGFIKLATDTGLIVSVEVENVYAQDSFSLSKNTDRTVLSHTINHRATRNTPDNPYFGTYVITRLVNDPERPLVEWVPAADIELMKKSSKNYDPNDKGCVWVKWEDEMRRKSAIKRAQKFWPKSDGRVQERLAAAVAIDNQHENQERAREAPIDSEAEIEPEVKKISKEQLEELTALVIKSRQRLENVCRVYFIDKLDDLPAKLFGEVKTRLENAAQLSAQKHAGNKGEGKQREPGEDG